MVLESITQTIASSVTSSVTYYTLAILFSIGLYILMRVFEFPKTYSGIAAVLVSILMLEFILRAIFSLAGIALNFGTYVIDVPYIGKTAITNGVMLWKFLDLAFNFGLIRVIGLPYYDEFLKTIPENIFPAVHLTAWTVIPHILSSPFNMFVFVYNSADSIIDFIFFYYLFAAIIILVADLLQKSTTHIKLYAGGLALIPVVLYSYYISNPFLEYERSLPELHKFSYFLQNAPTTTKVIFLATLIISFVLVMEILAFATTFVYALGAGTFRPGWEAKTWEANTQGIGFLYTLAFAIMYAMHQYAWYVFFPAIALYTIFKNAASGTSDMVKQHQETEKMKGYFQSISGGQNSTLPVKESDNSNKPLLFVGIAIVVLLGMLAWKLRLM